MNYNPKKYWEDRLTQNFNIRGVGHSSFSFGYNELLYKRKDVVIKRIFKNKELADENVLDIGCGTGFFIDWYIQEKARVVGIDITKTSINTLKERFDTEFHIQDISDVNYILAGRKFDIVNVWDVLYHIVDDKKYSIALQNIESCMNENGLLIVSDFLGTKIDINMANHVKSRSLKTYNTFLLKSNFELVEVFPLYNLLSKNHFRLLDELLKHLYYFLDCNISKVAKNNLSVGVWKYSSKNS